jgi:branched-chain amino acid transport system ATP-binding protein
MAENEMMKTSSEVVLRAEHLSIQFGGLRAVDDVNLTVRKGELYGLIGPNGAGKTTFFNLITGVYKPTSGRFFLCGEELTGKAPIEVNRRGIARTFQNIRLFGNLTVAENVMVGLSNQIKYSVAESLFRLPRHKKSEKEDRERAMEILKVFKLD